MAQVVMKYFKQSGRDHIALVFPYNESLINTCRALFARWSPAEMWWHLPYSEKVYARVVEVIRAHHMLDTSPFDRAYDCQKRAHKFKANDKAKVQSTLTSYAQEELDQYLQFLEGRRYSESTLRTYGKLLSSFFATIKFDEHLILTHEIIDHYNTFGIVRSGYSVSYQRQFVGAFKLYLRMHPEFDLSPDELERPSKEKRLPTVLSEEEVLRLIGAINSIKHRCIVALLYATGMRISELLGLRIRHIDFDRNTIHIVQSKGAKDRMIGLSPAIKIMVLNYREEHQSQEYLFNGSGGGIYSANSVRQILKRAARRAAIEKNVTPHVLRHSFATHLIDQGVNLRHVQELLGHSKPETTMIYTHVSTQKITNISSPFDNLLRKHKIMDDPKKNNPFPGLSRE